MHIKCVVFVSLAVAVFSSYADTTNNCFSTNDHRQPNRSGRQSLYTGQQGFSLALLEAINKLHPDENLFFSPYSTYHALLLAYFSAGNQTEISLKRTLRLDDAQEKLDIFNAYKFDKLLTATSSMQSSYEFTNANRIYVERSVKIRECMESLLSDEIQPTDFKGNPSEALNSINKWVENRTHDMIKDLLPPGSIDASTNLVLVNAAYFKGIWENKFDPELTKPEIFYITPQKKTFVDMMHVEGAFNHEVSDALMAHILELPYQGNDISMYILLPPFLKDDGVETILRELTVEKFKSLVDENSSLSPRTVNVALPKFSLEQTIEMVPVLAKLNIGNLFTSSADFSGLSETTKLDLGRAIHKARIEVNEQGTKAAAATVLFTFRSSRPAEPAIFHCNHPFVYVIYNKLEKAILFTGVFRRPY